MASDAQDVRAKTFQTDPQKANLYIYRNETFGAAIRMTVLVDGQHAGDTAAQTYILRSVAPGRHTIVSKSENDSTLTVDAVAGRNYFVWQEIKMGFMSGRSELQLVDEATGRKAVGECKLVE